jgi:membrane-associated PAP2 superfamily phosphatase
MRLSGIHDLMTTWFLVVLFFLSWDCHHPLLSTLDLSLGLGLGILLFLEI